MRQSDLDAFLAAGAAPSPVAPDDGTIDSESLAGDPIPEVFPPDDPVARFVVSMAMAGNDIRRAQIDVVRAAENDDPDYEYRVRLVIGHLVEAIDALTAYSSAFPAVGALIKRVLRESQQRLKLVRGTFQKAGPGALQCVRHNTFHYPSPDGNYSPTSDEQLATVLAGMGSQAVQVDFGGSANGLIMTLTFADDAAIELAASERASGNGTVNPFDVGQDSALAFVLWSSDLVLTYMQENGHYLDEAAVTTS